MMVISSIVIICLICIKITSRGSLLTTKGLGGLDGALAPFGSELIHRMPAFKKSGINALVHFEIS